MPPTLTLIATTDRSEPYGISIYLDPATGILTIDSWYDGIFQGPQMDIACTELQARMGGWRPEGERA